jgi:hypothetical protein
MINKPMFDRLAIIVVGVSDSGKTTTLKEYTDYYKDSVSTFKKGWRHGLSPFKPKFWTVKVSAYVIPKSPTESVPLKDTIDPLEWFPDVILMPEQLKGKEYQNSIDYLRSHDYHIKEFQLSNVSSGGVWDRWTTKLEQSTKLLYRREEIADYIRNFIKSRI